MTSSRMYSVCKVPFRSRLAFLAVSLLLAACGGALTQPAQPESAFPSPVAFVPAVATPMPTPTSTPPPTVAPTALPPTAVPKRSPIDTTSAIGLWSDLITSSAAFTGVVDLVVGPAGFDLRNSNMALVTLNSGQASVDSGDILTDTIDNHPDWVLHDKNKKVALSAAGAPLLDIRNDEVKRQLADALARRVLDGGYDGLILDSLGNDLIRKNLAPVYTGTKAFTGDQRRDAVEALVRAVRARLPDRLLIVGGYAWEDGAAYADTDTEASDLSAIGDGVYISEFLRAPISDTTDFKSETAWKRDIDYLAAISQDNRIVLVATRLSDAGATPDDNRQWLAYSVASYLLGKNGNRTYFQFDARGAAAYINDPLVLAPIGAPAEAYSKLDNGVYKRTFSNGLVLVNPTTKKKEIDLGADYLTLSGTPVQKVTLTANTGLILLKP